MTGLLEEVLEAHGGRPRWEAVRALVARVRTGGFALASRLQPRAFRQCEVTVTPAHPHAVIVPYGGPDRRGVFDGDTVRVETDEGRVVAERRQARASFAAVRRTLWWDALDALYFGGYAFWNYLSTPVLFLHPGVTIREGEPWEEGGERWRRLHVTFPADVPTHCREQVFSADAAGLLRRHDYTAEVFGGWARAAHYSRAHRTFAGLTLPTRRQVLPRRPDGRPRPWPTLVWIEIDDVRVLGP